MAKQHWTEEQRAKFNATIARKNHKVTSSRESTAVKYVYKPDRTVEHLVDNWWRGLTLHEKLTKALT